MVSVVDVDGIRGRCGWYPWSMNTGRMRRMIGGVKRGRVVVLN
jgi:hypothetical protein